MEQRKFFEAHTQSRNFVMREQLMRRKTKISEAEKTYATEELIQYLTKSARFTNSGSGKLKGKSLQRVYKTRAKLCEQLKTGTVKISEPLETIHYPGTPDFFLSLALERTKII